MALSMLPQPLVPLRDLAPLPRGARYAAVGNDTGHAAVRIGNAGCQHATPALGLNVVSFTVPGSSTLVTVTITSSIAVFLVLSVASTVTKYVFDTLSVSRASARRGLVVGRLLEAEHAAVNREVSGVVARQRPT